MVTVTGTRQTKRDTGAAAAAYRAKRGCPPNLTAIDSDDLLRDARTQTSGESPNH